MARRSETLETYKCSYCPRTFETERGRMTHERYCKPKENGNGSKRAAIVRPKDYRCDCGRLLFRAILGADSRVECRCVKCKRVSIFPDNARRYGQFVVLV